MSRDASCVAQQAAHAVHDASGEPDQTLQPLLTLARHEPGELDRALCLLGGDALVAVAEYALLRIADGEL